MTEELKALVKAQHIPPMPVTAMQLLQSNMSDLFEWCQWLEYTPITRSKMPWGLSYDGESVEDVGTHCDWLVRSHGDDNDAQWHILTQGEFNRQYQVIRSGNALPQSASSELTFMDEDNKTIAVYDKGTSDLLGYLRCYCSCWYYSKDRFGYDISLDEFVTRAKHKMLVGYRLARQLGIIMTNTQDQKETQA